MLLHDVSAVFPVNQCIVGIFHFKVKYTSYIVLYKGVSIMADSDKTLITDVSTSSNERKLQSPTCITSTCGTIHTDSQIHTLTASEFVGHKKKPTSFQITSVTVQGSRVSNDGGDDSADDLDESHTEDISSDILDCSRTTDLDNDQLSEDNSNANSSDLTTTPCQHQNYPIKCPVSNSTNNLTINVDVPLSVTVEVASNAINDVGSAFNLCSSDSSNSGTVESDEPVINPLPDQWQHRFKVVKIVSSEPFRRGRWLCMDFMDPPSVQTTELKQEASDLVIGHGKHLAGIDNSVGASADENLSVNRLAHIYEIPPNESYPGGISVSVSPHHVQQPLYGIILPVNNDQASQIAMVQSVGIQPLQTEQIQKPETSTTTQASTQQQAFSGQPSTFNAQQNFSHQSQQNQGLPPPSSVQQTPLSQSTQGISMTPQHQQQPAVASTSSTDTNAANSQQPSGSTNISSQAQVVSEPHIASQQVSQGSQQQNQGFQVHQNAIQPVQLPSNIVTPVSAASTGSSAVTSQLNQLTQISTNVPVTHSPTVQQASGMPGNQSTLNNQTSASPSIPEATLSTSNQSVTNPEVFNVPSQTLASSEIVGLRTPPTINPQALLEVLPETLCKNVVNGEDSESASGGTNTVAIDNKIEQAMDLVKSHLMFAVREEVDVLKEKITELMDRISQLEYENGFLKANASQETLSQLTQSQQLQQQQQQQQQQTQLPPQTTTSSVSLSALQQQQLPLGSIPQPQPQSIPTNQPSAS